MLGIPGLSSTAVDSGPQLTDISNKHVISINVSAVPESLNFASTLLPFTGSVHNGGSGVTISRPMPAISSATGSLRSGPVTTSRPNTNPALIILVGILGFFIFKKISR